MNAVVKPQKLETVFDHNITDEEFKQLFDFEESKDDYEFSLNQTDAYVDLHHLYELRGDHAMSQLFLNKLDEKTRNRITMHCCLG